ncbi:MAG: Hsp33 family molecular chaperone HslO [Candidatus Izemoplasma sp.]
MNDYLIKAYAFDGTVRIYTAVTTNLVGHAQEIHDLWPTAAAALGRLLTVSVIMGATYGDDDNLSIRVNGNGPVGEMVATTNNRGEVRGYVSHPHTFLQYDNGKLNVGKAVGDGFIHVTKDLTLGKLFTSSVAIQTGEIAEDFAFYFTSSEQIPSAVGLGVLVNDDNKVISSGGFILQVMPGCSDESITAIEETLKTIMPVSEMVEKGYTAEDMMNELTNNNYQFLEKLDLKYECDCSRGKFEKGLISLGKAQLQEILDEDKKIETVCHFCNTKYMFDEVKLSNLIKESK